MLDTGPPVYTYFVLVAGYTYETRVSSVKLLLPTVTGYAVRSDIIERRFLTCQLADKVADFTAPRQHIQAFEYNKGFSFQYALSTAVGAIYLKHLPGPDRGLVERAMASLEADVRARLSFPWIVDKPLPRKRLALVDGKPYPDVSTAPLGIYRAAKTLGIELVVIDREGHWTGGAAGDEWCDEFIPCDLTLDDGLPDRIAAALSISKAPIDHITTYSDKLLPDTAKAAEKVGMFTSPAVSMDICHNKRRTREFAPPVGFQVLALKGVADLTRQLASLTSPLEYPLIVKPIIGYSSEGVTKVSSESQLFDAVRRNEETFPDIGSLIEPYISGPEVDANFVLMDGELVWGEINDDFPSHAEISRNDVRGYDKRISPSVLPSQVSAPTSALPHSFAELSTIMPSILPEQEIALLKSQLTETLFALGFKNGVFHLEARVQNSKMEYAMTSSGMELLQSRSDMGNASKPKVFLIEINPRVPGHQETFAVEYTYGIDYFVNHMLAALSPSASAPQNDDDHLALKAVIRSLSHPLPERVQFPTHVVFIPLNRGGTFVSAKLPPEELMQYVPEHFVFMKAGEVCQDPAKDGKWPFVAYFQVVATLTGAEGRAQARTIGELVRESFEYAME
ncbi:ATP-grasp fold domain containing protein [Cordyceps fumosorosea ARSEF 2679]|uniref:ATP-grasp fold domain containing protein n=1 Tax=Cordyceps fumosorosea (strain ARSEF 2679) TaxID=1081104 RepID=A0A167PLX0_CORFA|nr:ATP-grasp fold domain containing protein [Cordyceps fumosorosea ARSEF 2679]OAA56799.1 ATP-grasp fold domain containing protein [Cordyceps fumosorosea ARSEF 2679]